MRKFNQQDQQFLSYFSERAQDHLIVIEEGLLNLQNSKTPDLVNEILRSVVSLKEGAEVVGVDSIYQVTKYLQDCLELLRDYPQLEVDLELESLFLQGFDALDSLVKELNPLLGLSEENAQQLMTQGEIAFATIDERLNLMINPLVPFSEIEQIFPLTFAVQEVSTYYGKHAEVKIQGGEVLMRQSILKHFSKLLKHFINNAIAHGIETPDVRQILGKSPLGLITIGAFFQGGKVAITFSDDGAGIDVERVKSKAIAKGNITESQAREMSSQDAYQLILLADFSTKDEKDLISGLGFGMNAIEQEVKKTGGVIKIESQLGQGTTFMVLYP